MEIQDFEDILVEHDIKYRKSGQSIVCQECPSCGDRLFKVHFNAVSLNGRAREASDPVLGKCFRGSCGSGFSSRSYLIAMGLDEDLVDSLHSVSHLTEAELAYWTGAFAEKEPIKNEQTVTPVPAVTIQPVDISGFLPLEAWPEHPVTLYAKRRGATADNTNIMIDPLEQAVVFVVTEGGVPVGWQKRFINPSSIKLKTKTSAGFQKTGHVLRFERPNVPQIVCEGPFSALSGWHYGFDGVCTFGANPSTKQLQVIADRALKLKMPVAIGYDVDEAGDKGAKQIQRFMSRMGIQTFFVTSNGYNDLNDAWMAKATVQTTKPTLTQWILDDIPAI